jgi:hypothetical protein
MHVSIVSIRICLLECGKLNVRSFVSTFAPKIVALKFFGSGNVMVPSVKKFGFATKNISFSLSMTPSLDH